MFSIVDASHASTSREQTQNEIDWKKCFLCQQETSEKLRDPKNAPAHLAADSGCCMLARNLPEFHAIGELPFPIDLSLINDGSGIQSFLEKKGAMWHFSCYVKCNNSKLKRAKAKHEGKMRKGPCTEPSPKKTRLTCNASHNPELCLFCDKPASRGNALHQVQTPDCNKHITKGSEILKDTKLKAKISERCDLIALEAKYHTDCYAKFRKRVKQQENSENTDEQREQIEALSFAGLVSYLREVCENDDSTSSPVFSMPQLARLYAEGMRELGLEYGVHNTRLKHRILEACPFLQAHEQKGKETLLSVRQDVSSAVQKLVDRRRDYEEESRVFCEAAVAARKDVFIRREREESNADNSLEQVTAPPSLVCFVKLLFNGPCASNRREEGDDHVDQTIAQLLAYHIVKRRTGKSRRHNKQQETPAPCYLAMKLYGETRKRKLIETTHRMGLSISYSRLDTILTEKANDVCAYYHATGVVCPRSVVCGQNIFTTASVDNIDHTTSSTTATSSFHGTAISLMQHFLPGQLGIESVRETPLSETPKRRKVMKLPEEYCTVRPCFTDVRKANCTLSPNYSIEGSPVLDGEISWLEKCVGGQCVLPWSEHHAAKDTGEKHQTKTALLPLFAEYAASAAMMRHTLEVVGKAVAKVNSEQIPVVVGDQPLYALLKQVQYTFPDTHGENKYFIMMGGLHIEMAALRIVGDWLDGSGWVSALTQAEVTTEGRAESLIKASHVTRTRYALQVTAVALFALQQNAYSEYCEQETDDLLLSFDDWKNSKNSIPQFRYWNTAMKLCLLVLQFVRSQRTAHFDLYITSLRQLVPWFFALDHVHYARWLSVHVRDLTALQDTHPSIYREFQRGLFVARTTQRAFSAMGLDQAHEQINARIKGDGGMVGITESPSSLLKWLLAAPELAALVHDFEQKHLHLDDIDDSTTHHDKSPATRMKFAKDVESLTKVMAELGNPFMEDSEQEIYNLETKNVASKQVTATVMTIETLGETLYQTFVTERLESGEKHLMDSLKLNKLPLLGTGGLRKQSRSQVKMATLKEDCSLFRRLYISTCNSNRKNNLDEFFKHENQPQPPALSFGGEPTSCDKSDLIHCLIDASEEATSEVCPKVDAIVIDGPAVVHILGSQKSKTFGDYIDSVIKRFVDSQLGSVDRIDFVWDRYDPNSLKHSTRQKRGDGARTKVTLQTKVPKNWARFLRDATNKQELFRLIGKKVTAPRVDGKEVYSTLDDAVLTSTDRDVTGSLAPCNHEEADTRIMVHVQDAVKRGLQRIMIRTVDTDVLVVAVSCVPLLSGIKELWLHIGTGNNQKFIAVHNVSASLGPAMSRALPVFHALTGCDQISSFRGRSKNSAFEAWMSFPEVTNAFLAIAGGYWEEAMPLIEKFVIALYDRSCSCTTVNECRRYLITKRDRQAENIPPSRGALEKHVQRSKYIGGCVWGQALELIQTLPSPSQSGWSHTSSGWKPVWTDLPPASKACRALIRCSCKKGCTNRCKCIKEGLGCSESCFCSNNCGND
ncbi:Envelopment polyprotein [Frankliniella fusca]|uniref:Envelopment polyprotein n=1 Tax=Frankliniella fusca TaxID=407009 RepID=A0AAE1HL88_9NEOP|nr:Envelopment polyprotein [Frankliniella fusca]